MRGRTPTNGWGYLIAAILRLFNAGIITGAERDRRIRIANNELMAEQFEMDLQ